MRANKIQWNICLNTNIYNIFFHTLTTCCKITPMNDIATWVSCLASHLTKTYAFWEFSYIQRCGRQQTNTLMYTIEKQHMDDKTTQ